MSLTLLTGLLVSCFEEPQLSFRMDLGRGRWITLWVEARACHLLTHSPTHLKTHLEPPPPNNNPSRQ